MKNLFFNGINYLSREFCIKEKSWRPNYANICTGNIKNTLVSPYIKVFSKVFSRFINDVKFYWKTGLLPPIDKIWLQIIKEQHKFCRHHHLLEQTKNNLLTTAYREHKYRRIIFHNLPNHLKFLKDNMLFRLALCLTKFAHKYQITRSNLKT